MNFSIATSGSIGFGSLGLTGGTTYSKSDGFSPFHCENVGFLSICTDRLDNQAICVDKSIGSLVSMNATVCTDVKTGDANVCIGPGLNFGLLSGSLQGCWDIPK